MKKIVQTIKKQWAQVLAVFVFIFFIGSRLWMYVRYGAAGFGYDTGIYRHYIRGYFERFGDNTIEPFGFSSFSNALHFLGNSTDNILFFWYMFIGVILGILFYTVVQLYTKNKNTALIAFILFSTSIVQFEFFWWFYYRNTLGLFFVLLSFIFLYYRSYLLILTLLVIGTIHPLSLIPIGLMLIIQCIFDKEKRTYLFISGGVALFAILLLNIQEIKGYASLLFQKDVYVDDLAKQNEGEFTGQFISLAFYVRVAFIYIIFGLLGVVYYFKKYKELGLFLVINAILFALGILFYRRFIIFFDIAALFFASVFLSHLLEKSKQSQYVKVVSILFFALLFFQQIRYIADKRPLVRPLDVRNVESIDQLISSDAYILTINSHYAPWLQGFTTKDIIAPGMFEHDQWTFSQWEQFWYSPYSEDRLSLLALYSKDIYIFIGDKDRTFISILESDEHFIPITAYLWRVSL
ncbi:EpsG family protein [Patescibacteria group bacterium]|nr:EpsG family protein [Patescibacteria group bacterium]MBU1721599.1 EpsG family protein [Patescibacteria group bacterium]MBU1901825.1 EpsG family protein [Patescibacteria group bacterium]